MQLAYLMQQDTNTVKSMAMAIYKVIILHVTVWIELFCCVYTRNMQSNWNLLSALIVDVTVLDANENPLTKIPFKQKLV